MEKVVHLNTQNAQELAEQACVTIIRGHYDESGSTRFELEKFAKLIVRECADFVAAGEFGDSGTAKELKEHFGVES